MTEVIGEELKRAEEEQQNSSTSNTSSDFPRLTADTLKQLQLEYKQQQYKEQQKPPT